ncbi:helix-turn-helix domain-containing protein [Candidatus Uabimicrobium sp. HlEnr_7]|uniref:helix-turn-helix domain-containing protein n=1 Tax=Candidatus Uabimicrobium helgolandensis TaxID=3095367 RepID=UPI003557005B
MKENQRQKISFFRYQVIAPILNLPAECSLQEAIKELAEKEYSVPESLYPKKFSAKTIEKWFYGYKKRGLDFLKPAKRNDRGESKTIVGEVATEIEKMLLERPSLTGAIVLKELEARGLVKEGEISLSAFYRFRRGRKLNKEDVARLSNFKAYEFEFPQDCFQTDVMFGPSLATKKGTRKKTYLIAVIDDCTRVVTHGQFYFEQNLATFVDTLK